MPGSGHQRRFLESVIWVKRMLPAIDFIQEEMGYKEESAARLAATRQLLKEKDPEWVVSFTRAFKGSNLPDWRYTDQLKHLAVEQPEALASLLHLLWQGNLSEASFNRFVTDLRALNAALTPGVGTAIASVLLMARGAFDHPPYRWEAVRRFWNTVEWPVTKNEENPYRDYRNFRVSLEAFRRAAAASGLPVENLLAAQGYMWLITEWDPREVLQATDIATFRAWRGDPLRSSVLEDDSAAERRMQILEQLERNPTRFFTREDLAAFTVDGDPVDLLHSTVGTVAPAGFDVPVSLTLPSAIFTDGLASGLDDAGIVRYRSKNPNRSDRAHLGLLSALEARVPMVVFAPAGDGIFQAVFPVYLYRYLHHDRVFELDFNFAYLPGLGAAPEYERRWTVRAARQRLHQAVFRRDVLRAYNHRCAVCGLGIVSLLDAAHIIPDREDSGIASATNGMALCKNHHAAFDADLLSVDAELIVHIEPSAINSALGDAEHHLLGNYDRRRLAVIPNNAALRPDPVFLAQRQARSFSSPPK